MMLDRCDVTMLVTLHYVCHHYCSDFDYMKEENYEKSLFRIVGCLLT